MAVPVGGVDVSRAEFAVPGIEKEVDNSKRVEAVSKTAGICGPQLAEGLE